MAKRGIDISAHQGNIDLGALKDQIDFVIIRVGFGTKGTIDNKFKRNADLCKSLGIPMGFYWYSYALDVSGAEKEAKAFLNAIAPYTPEYGCWFDMEDADGYKKRNGMPSNTVLKNICYKFCEIVENAGYYSGVYASLSWFKNQLAGDKLSRFDKWIAMWPTKGGKQRGLAVSPDEEKNLSLWQFTSDGTFAGYNGRLDTNYAYKSFATPQPIPEPIPTPTPIPTPEPVGTVLDLAARVMKGEFGDGEERKNKLGSRYDEVQDFINYIFSTPVDTLAKEVIIGKYGNDATRKAVLGSKYEEVQKEVNKLLHTTPSPVQNTIVKGCKVKFLGTKSYSGIKLADWTHGGIFDVIELSGDRVVIGKGTAVTAAVNIRDCQRV